MRMGLVEGDRKLADYDLLDKTELRLEPVTLENANLNHIAEVIAAVDENVDTTRCGGAHNCQNEGPCLTHDLWHDLSTRIYDYLNRISLQDLVDRKGVQDGAKSAGNQGAEVRVDSLGSRGLAAGV